MRCAPPSGSILTDHPESPQDARIAGLIAAAEGGVSWVGTGAGVAWVAYYQLHVQGKHLLPPCLSVVVLIEALLNMFNQVTV